MPVFFDDVVLPDVPEGTDANLDWTFTDPDSGNRVDITDWEVGITIKDHSSDPDSEAIVDESVTSHPDPENGETQLDINGADTESEIGRRYLSIWVILPNESRPRVIATGTIEFVESVKDY